MTVELKARQQTGAAIRALLNLNSKFARKIMPDGGELDVALGEAKVGESRIVRPSEKIPMDGIVTFGYSSVDESMVTGDLKFNLKTPSLLKFYARWILW